MRLGSETNSVVNHIYSRAVIGQPEPQVGMGGTVLHWTDRDPVTIFRVFKVGKSVLIETRDDDYRRTDANGMSEEQDYEYITNVNGARRYFRLESSGRWVNVRKNEDTGRWGKTGGCGFRIGERNKYYDYSF